jgi:hydrogenase maturation factor
MCTNSILQVKKLAGTIAIMTNGRKVHLGSTHSVSVGDYLEVYADLAIDKIDTKDAHTITAARSKRRLP